MIHQNGRLYKEGITLLVDSLEIVNHLLLDFVNVCLMEIKMSNEIHFKLE